MVWFGFLPKHFFLSLFFTLKHFNTVQLDRQSEVRESVRDFTRRRIHSLGGENIPSIILQLRRHVSQPDELNNNHSWHQSNHQYSNHIHLQ